jgi:folate-dependent tRNA-U54 methylase TrmFO/GidA
MIHSLKGLENAKMMRTAYAIEYDCIDATMLYSTLEFKDYPFLYGAGQFNGSSGYEEAAAQGLMAGINAALKILERERVMKESKVEVTPLEHGYHVTFIVMDVETELLKITVYVADASQIELVKRNFYDKAITVYSDLISALTVE